MRPSEACLALIRQSEGLKLAAYQDVGGVWTIGYGHTGTDVTPGLKWTEQIADSALGIDAQKACDAVQRLVRVPLTQGQLDALTDFVFNLGQGALQGSTLLRLLNMRQYGEIPAQLERWVYAGGNVQAGLMVRRQAEARMWAA